METTRQERSLLEMVGSLNGKCLIYYNKYQNDGWMHPMGYETASLTFPQILTLERDPSFGTSRFWVRVPALTLRITVTSGNSFDIPESQFPQL